MPVTPIQRLAFDEAREALIAHLRAKSLEAAKRRVEAKAARYRQRLLEKAAYQAMRDLNLIEEG